MLVRRRAFPATSREKERESREDKEKEVGRRGRERRIKEAKNEASSNRLIAQHVCVLKSTRVRTYGRKTCVSFAPAFNLEEIKIRPPARRFSRIRIVSFKSVTGLEEDRAGISKGVKVIRNVG